LTRRAAIIYDGLPISSGGAHKLRTRGFTDALLVLQSFVTAVSVDPRPKDCVVDEDSVSFSGTPVVQSLENMALTKKGEGYIGRRVLIV
jgi:hypothetical protein